MRTPAIYFHFGRESIGTFCTFGETMSLLKMAESKKHHYVPRSILKNFSIDNKGGMIYTFRKVDGEIFPQSIGDAGAENHFNTLKRLDLNFESIFNDVDGALAQYIQRIVECRSIEFIKDDNEVRIDFMNCISVLYVRGKIWRKTMQSLVRQQNDIIDKHFAQIGIQRTPEIPDDDAKTATLLALENASAIADALLNKELVLLEAPINRYFYISDTPIATLNRLPYSSQDIYSFETEVYFPISPKLALGFFSKGLLEMYKDREPSFRIDSFCKSGVPIEVSNKQSTTMNYAQIKDACEYIYSAYDDFFIAKYLIASNPVLKNRESTVMLGELGEGRIVSKDMPKGINLVLYGQVKSHLIPIDMIQKDIRLQFTTTHTQELKRAILDAPFIKGSVYNHNKTIKEMKFPYFVRSKFNGDDFFEMGFNHENIDQFMIELTKNENITKEELEKIANKYLSR